MEGEYKIMIKEGAQPVVHAPRKVPVIIKKQIK